MSKNNTKDGEELARELSTESSTRIASLQELEKELRGLQDRLDVASGKRSELAQIVGLVDALEAQVDAVITADLSSGKSTAKIYRKALVARLEAMREHAAGLYEEEPWEVVKDDSVVEKHNEDDDTVEDDHTAQPRDEEMAPHEESKGEEGGAGGDDAKVVDDDDQDESCPCDKPCPCDDPCPCATATATPDEDTSVPINFVYEAQGGDAKAAKAQEDEAKAKKAEEKKKRDAFEKELKEQAEAGAKEGAALRERLGVLAKKKAAIFTEEEAILERERALFRQRQRRNRLRECLKRKQKKRSCSVPAGVFVLHPDATHFTLRYAPRPHPFFHGPPSFFF